MAGADPKGQEVESAEASSLTRMALRSECQREQSTYWPFCSVWASYSLAVDSERTSQEKLLEGKHCQSSRLHGLFSPSFRPHVPSDSTDGKSHKGQGS